MIIKDHEGSVIETKFPNGYFGILRFITDS